jgi:hypothetical protein
MPKSEDVTLGDVGSHFPNAPEESKPSLYTIYASAADVPYQPEEALKEGLSMVKTLKANIKKLELGSKLRQEVWMREIDRYLDLILTFDIIPKIFCSLQSQGAPTTMIAVCGGGYLLNVHKARLNVYYLATGAGKSSILNAILDGRVSFRQRPMEHRVLNAS